MYTTHRWLSLIALLSLTSLSSAQFSTPYRTPFRTTTISSAPGSWFVPTNIILNPVASTTVITPGPGGLGAVSSPYPFAPYAAHPYALGLPTNLGTTPPPFGAPLYSNLAGGSPGPTNGAPSATSRPAAATVAAAPTTAAPAPRTSGTTPGGSVPALGVLSGQGTTGGGIGTMAPVTTWSALAGRSQASLNGAAPIRLTAPTTTTRTSPLQAEVQSIVANSSALPSRDQIQVGVEGGTIVLRGTVSTDYERRLAEALVRLTPGVNLVRNELIVP